MLEEIRHWLRPPAAQVEDAPAPKAAPSFEDVAKIGPPLGFVIDDDEGVSRFVMRALESLGLEARRFRDAPTAVAALDVRLPEIIFLDVALEKSDAIEVIRGLGERSYKGVVQLISGSNVGLLEDVKRIGERHGLSMRAPLEKPFRAETLRNVVRDAGLGGQTAERLPSDATKPAVSLALAEALRLGWLEVWYQPKIDLKAMCFAGAEALIRCRHPQHGILAPAHFLDGADARSMADLTVLVLKTVLSDWPDFARVGIPMHAAMNAPMSALSTLPIAALLREHRPRDERWPGLIIEMSECEVIKDIALAHEIVTQLRIYDVSFAIDDFGEGYSSFSRLRELPFGEIKLDRSCVSGCATDPKKMGICRAIIELAHQFGCTAVAEGVETASDLQILHRLGCDVGQGYFLGRPMPKEQLVAALGQIRQGGGSTLAAAG
jgi:EAL domain-containing protein (putative c-di-GMP-specific phosphodiesterase class I)/FixJ family two-component response regulator